MPSSTGRTDDGPGSSPSRRRVSRSGLIVYAFVFAAFAALWISDPDEWALAVTGIGALTFWMLVGVIWETVWHSNANVPAKAAAPPSAEPVEPHIGVEELGTYLEQRRRQEEAEAQAEKERQQRLKDLWSGVAPSVAEAVEMVNVKIAAHGMHLAVSEPDFMGPRDDPSGFGVQCELEGADRSLGCDGVQYVAVSEDHLYVGGSHSWAEGKELPLEDPPVGAIADTLAESVKWSLEG